MAPYSLFHATLNEVEALAGVSDREVIDPVALATRSTASRADFLGRELKRTLHHPVPDRGLHLGPNSLWDRLRLLTLFTPSVVRGLPS